MPRREQVKKSSPPKKEEEVVEEVPPASDDRSAVDREALDALLDEIDEVLETNAETFVKEYVQKGGQ